MYIGDDSSIFPPNVRDETYLDNKFEEAGIITLNCKYSDSAHHPLIFTFLVQIK